MLTLTIKTKWFDMIIKGDKLEEYREIKPYYETRFKNLFGEIDDAGNHVLNEESTRNHRIIKLKNGYAANAPFILVDVTLREDFGVRDWGAIPCKLYYVLKIHKIIQIHGVGRCEAYLCDGEGCSRPCHGKSDYCKHTSDINHAIYFDYIEK